ncbi:DNA polymerase III subunit gamma/tau [Candidatus Peregrinibacteria bacterium]|nr:DNA polymerase III subunit gamma/tau [Candidatus Peregrinibacteria bacterium]
MSLYSKYRPQNFANLVGQEHIRLTILHEIQKGTVSHAYLFAGPRGTGKTSTARLIAKSLNCEKRNAEGEPCDTCSMCTGVKDGSLIDVIEIDAASNRGIEEIRDLKEKIQFAPTRAKSKTYIMDEIHMLTKEAFNALLKTLEEPPENVYFILCTTEVHKIPETIISRCQRFDFKRIDVKTIMTRLNYIAQMEKIEAEDAAIEMIARHVEGGMRDAIGLFEQMMIDGKLLVEHVRSHLGITGHQTVLTLLDVLGKKDVSKAIHLVNEVHREGYDLSSFVREILECLRERLISGIQQGNSDASIWLAMIGHFEEARDMLRNTVIPQLPLEIAVIKICEKDGSITEEIQEVAEVKKAVKQAVKVEPAKPRIEAKPVMEGEPAETAAEEKTATAIKQEYEMEGIMKHWPRVLERVQPPSLKRSLSDAKTEETAKDTVTLTFGSRFHMEKVNTIENKSKIESAINQIFGKTVTVKLSLDETMKKAPTAPAPAEMGAREKPLQSQQKPAADLAEKAMEIFGDDEF